MAKKKLSTKDILAAARAEMAGKAQDAPADESAGSQEDVAQSPAAEDTKPSSKKPAAKSSAPKSTKDILAAARAQAGGASSDSAPAEKKPASPPAKKPSGSAKPTSTSDILAAARAQAGGGSAAAESAEKPAAGKSSPKAPGTKKPVGERPSVQEMLKAVRGETSSAKAEPAVASKPTLPPRPQKPQRSQKPSTAPQTRRGALTVLLMAPLLVFGNAFVVAWTMLAAASTAFVLAMARFMMPNVLVEPPSKFKVGPASDYPLGGVSTKWKSQFGVWIVHATFGGKNLVYALSTVCTHLGCTPNWLEGEQKFKCPCHGSGFYKTGVNFEGPAPRPLERHGIRLAEDGMLEVDKSVKFQEEMGQWDDAASFVELA